MNQYLKVRVRAREKPRPAESKATVLLTNSIRIDWAAPAEAELWSLFVYCSYELKRGEEHFTYSPLWLIGVHSREPPSHKESARTETDGVYRSWDAGKDALD